MALQKQNAQFSFAQGIDTKTDEYQLPIGKLSVLENAIFTKSKKIIKRNGFKKLTELPDPNSDFLCTFNNDLVAIGTTLQTYSSSSDTWQSRGELVPLDLTIVPLVRRSTNQIAVDSVTSPGGLTCTVFSDNNINQVQYCISDSITGVYVVSPTNLAGYNSSYGSARVFLLPSRFIIFYTHFKSGSPALCYISIPLGRPSQPTAEQTLDGNYSVSSSTAFDGVVMDDNVYIAYADASGAAINLLFITNTLVVSSTKIVDNVHTGTIFTLAAEAQYSYVWITYYNSPNAYTVLTDENLNIILSATNTVGLASVPNLSSYSHNGQLNIFIQHLNSYSFDASLRTDYLIRVTVTSSGTVAGPFNIARSVGMFSKPFLLGSTIYLFAHYISPYQSTYFLIDIDGNVVSKFAYQNAVSSYITAGLSYVSVNDNIAQVPYLFQYSINSVNKIGSITGTGLYGQVGVNLASFNFSTEFISVAEVGKNLHITGGFLWAYDGNTICEQNFHLWPDFDLTTGSNGSSKSCSFSNTGGSISTQNYFYIGVYEWQDNQGNVHRSGTSIQIPVNSADLTGSSNTITVKFPTLRLTYKTANAVKLTLYRASAAQSTFYLVTSVSSPVLNDPTVDSVNIADTSSDSTIIGNTILYTTGGVLENTGGPAFTSIGVYDNRLFGILSENTNTLMFSQAIADASPVELSLFLTKYISPTIGSEGSTGPDEALAVMDDKLVIFKKSAIYYFNGTGPSLTGSNNLYSDPNFVTSTVGSTNQNSIVFTPVGLIFQSDLGLWVLGRNLDTQYIGADVEAYNNQRVQSASAVPGTTYVLFVLESGTVLMYDYYYNQWGTFTGIPGVSATIYQGAFTFINQFKQVYQENPGVYLDGASPVSMALQTGWINAAGLQGYQRLYRMFLIGTYKSPHKLHMQIGYDYNPAPLQSFTVPPINTSNLYGIASPYGTDNYGGSTPLEQFQINFKQQKCQAFQLYLKEYYDPSQGISVGQGLSLSGLNIIFGYKKGFPRVAPNQQVG